MDLLRKIREVELYKELQTAKDDMKNQKDTMLKEEED